MTIPRIKICGIQNVDEANLCLLSGADSLGFLLELTHKAEDKITRSQAKAIIQELPAGTNTVMVTHCLEWQTIADIAQDVSVTCIQIHDDLNIEGIKALRAALPEVTLLKAIHVPFTHATSKEKTEVTKKALNFAEYVDALLLDSRTKDRLGGTGLTHDWITSAEIVKNNVKPVIIAGGLTPSNVEEAIIATSCFGVDVNSGVEDEQGRKDKTKVKTYCEIASRTLKLRP